MLLTDGEEGALLTGSGKVDVCLMVLVQTLMSTGVGEVEGGEGQSGEAAQVTSLGARPVAALTELL